MSGDDVPVDVAPNVEGLVLSQSQEVDPSLDVDPSDGPIPNEEHTPENNEEADELFNNVLGELSRLHTLAKEVSSDVHVKNLKRLLGRLKCRSTPSQAVDLMLRVNAASSTSTKKGRHMKVQPTGIARRKEGKNRGCKKIPAGRPPIGQPPTKKPKHCLSQSVRKNKTHAKGHGH